MSANASVSLQRGLVAELKGSACRCGGAKKPRQTFCPACYFALNPQQRKALYRRIGEGYEEAYAQAIEQLQATRRVTGAQA